MPEGAGGGGRWARTSITMPNTSSAGPVNDAPQTQHCTARRRQGVSQPSGGVGISLLLAAAAARHGQQASNAPGKDQSLNLSAA